jgi:hypothetical protein
MGDNSGHYLNNIEIPKFRLEDFQNSANGELVGISHIFRRIEKYNLSEHDKRKVIKLLREPEFICDSLTLTINKLNLLVDHIDQLNKLIEYNINVRFRFNNYDEFHNEHLSFARLLLQIKKQYYGIKRFYDDTIKAIDSNKTYFDQETNTEYRFNFKLLTTELEYIDEGSHMHHCVAGYFDKETSIIVSIRDTKSKDRVTCEHDVKTGKLLQSRYFCNQNPPDHFLTAITDLTNITRILAIKNSLNVIETTRVKSETYVEDVFF